MSHERTKHIDVRYHFVRDIVEDGNIEILEIGIADNPIDILTKLLPRTKFEHCFDIVIVFDICT